MRMKKNEGIFTQIFLILIIVNFNSCSRSLPQKPEEFLEEYIKKSIKTGQIEKDHQIILESINIKNKNCSNGQCQITYLLKYQSENNKKGFSFKTEVKKMAILKLYKGKWIVIKVLNMNTSHQAKEPIIL